MIIVGCPSLLCCLGYLSDIISTADCGLVIVTRDQVPLRPLGLRLHGKVVSLSVSRTRAR